MMPPPMTTTRARSGSLPPADDEADEDDGDDEGEDADGPDDGSDIGGYYRKAIRACVGAGARRLAYDGGAAAAGWACNAAHSGHARGACGTSWRCSSRTAREISARSRRTSRRAPATRAIFM